MAQNMKEILVTRSSMPSFEEYMEEIRPIWDSHWLTNMGPKHAELAEKLREYLGVERKARGAGGKVAGISGGGTNRPVHQRSHGY